MREVKTEEQLIDILKADEFIVIDRLCDECHIYDYKLERHHRKETFSLSLFAFKYLEAWTERGVISRDIFISPQTAMAVIYGKWCDQENGIQNADAAIIAREMGL